MCRSILTGHDGMRLSHRNVAESQCVSHSPGDDLKRGVNFEKESIAAKAHSIKHWKKGAAAKLGSFEFHTHLVFKCYFQWLHSGDSSTESPCFFNMTTS